MYVVIITKGEGEGGGNSGRAKFPIHYHVQHTLCNSMYRIQYNFPYTRFKVHRVFPLYLKISNTVHVIACGSRQEFSSQNLRWIKGSHGRRNPDKDERVTFIFSASSVYTLLLSLWLSFFLFLLSQFPLPPIYIHKVSVTFRVHDFLQ